MLSIPTYIKDVFYAYKMPVLITQVQQHKKSIKTSLPNLPAVARSLSIPTEYTLKYFGLELGTEVEYRPLEEKYTIQGSFEQEDLQQLLDRFIEKFVLCPRCCLPEFRIEVHRHKLIGLCNACGTRSDIDMDQKLASYILEHPPVKNTIKKKEKTHFEFTKTSLKESRELSLDSPTIEYVLARLNNIKWKQTENVIYKEIDKITLGFEPEFKIYVILKAFYAHNLHKMLRDPRQIEILKTYCQGLTDEFILAFAAVYVPELQMHQWVPTILKLLYDQEILDESTLLAWQNGQFTKVSSVASTESVESLRIIASEFLEWLMDAEEEEEDIEDSGIETEESKGNSKEEESKENSKEHMDNAGKQANKF